MLYTGALQQGSETYTNLKVCLSRSSRACGSTGQALLKQPAAWWLLEGAQHGIRLDTSSRVHHVATTVTSVQPHMGPVAVLSHVQFVVVLQCFCYVCDVRASQCKYWGTGEKQHDTHSTAATSAAGRQQ